LNGENTTKTQRPPETNTKMVSLGPTKAKSSRAPRPEITKSTVKNQENAKVHKGTTTKRKRPATNHAAKAAKLELESLEAVFCRRKMSPRKIKEKIAFLIGKVGMTPKQIAKETGMSLRTIRKYIPQKLKNRAMVRAGRHGIHEKRKLKNYKKRQSLKSSKKPRPKPLIPLDVIIPYLSLGGTECLTRKRRKQATRKQHQNFRGKRMW
jgi:DNA-binding CsgD family transcriptional regulator